MGARILIAEDNRMQAEVAQRYLWQDGHVVELAFDGAAAIDAARRTAPDLVVLDVMMPHTDGHQVCRVLRHESDVLILMLTARSTEDDLLLGLRLGADDYLTKPYSPRELAARVGALLRRAGRVTTSHHQVVTVGALQLDVTTHEVRIDGRTVVCTPGEFAMLALLAEQPGQVFSRRQLLDADGDLSREAADRTVDVHVHNLRKKLEADPSRPTMVCTVFGVGYRLGDVSRPRPGG